MSDYRKRQEKKEKPSTSHIMVFVILIAYIVVIIVGIVFPLVVLTEDSSKITALVSLFSYAGICGTTTITVYSIKASKENQIKISNDIYRMKLNLAKEIYKEVSNKNLDDKSILLLNLLNEEKTEDNLASVINAPNPQLQIPTFSRSDDGLGEG